MWYKFGYLGTAIIFNSFHGAVVFLFLLSSYHLDSPLYFTRSHGIFEFELKTRTGRVTYRQADELCLRRGGEWNHPEVRGLANFAFVFPPKRKGDNVHVKWTKRIEVYGEMKWVFNLRVGWVMVGCQHFSKTSFSHQLALHSATQIDSLEFQGIKRNCKDWSFEERSAYCFGPLASN